MQEPLLDWLLNVDVGIASGVALYLYHELKRVRKEKIALRKAHEEFVEEYISYIKTQAEQWKELSTAVRKARQQLKNGNGS
jgi:hypothetical protein